MSDDSLQPEVHDDEGNEHRHGGRQKQKIRIKYRQRVKVKKRPRGYKITRYWKKNRKNMLAYLVLILLLGATLFMVMQVAKQQLERNQHNTRRRL